MHHIFKTEEDLKEKVVSTWLADHGFSSADIFLEKGFSIRLGRAIIETGKSDFAHGRSDYLVKTPAGLNLMIVEVKAPTERLNDNSRDQGISYARLLTEGGIAPYVVLTNGTETRIYDSISRDLLNGISVPVDHCHALNGFRFCGDDVNLRAESLRILISLSHQNLLTFCSASVAFHMGILRSDDPLSEKKYIPQLHVQRADTAKEVFEKINCARVTLIVGKPQVGKTSFLCWLAEESLRRSEACLFYPAISLRRGILEDLCEDFHWTFGGSNIIQTAQRIISFLTTAKCTLRVIIDGWNEAEIEVARVLDQECQRLSADCLSFVISFV